MGVGLGDAFLRHIQRTRVLIHMLDGLAEDPLADFSQINSELALFDPKLGKKPQVVAFNKMDMPEAQERWPKVKKELGKARLSADGDLRADAGEPSAAAVEGLRAAANRARTRAGGRRRCQYTVLRPIRSAFTIERTDDGGYRVTRRSDRARRGDDLLGRRASGAALPAPDRDIGDRHSAAQGRHPGRRYGLYRRL